MSTSSKIIKNTGFLYVKMGINVFISLYTTRIILNSLGTSDFGVFNVVGGAIAMLSFLNASMASATQRFMNYSEGEEDEIKERQIFNTSVILHFIIALFVGILLIFLKPVFFDLVLNISEDKINAAKWIYNFMIVSTMFTIMTVPYDAVINAHENMRYYSIVGIMESVLKLSAAIIITILLSNKLIWYGAMMSMISFIVMIIMRIYCKIHYRECKSNLTKYFDRKTLKDLTSFAGWSLLGSSAGIISGYGSNIVLNNFYGTILNATNGICGQLNGQMLAFSNNLLKAVNPVIVKKEGGGHRDDMYLYTNSACKLSVLMFAFSSIPFFVECPYILKLWLKNVPPYALVFCEISVFTVLLEQLTNPLGTVIGAIGKIKLYNIFTSISLYLNIILLYLCYKVGLPPYSLVVLGLINAFIMSVFKVYYCYKFGGMKVSIFVSDVVIRCLLVVSIVYLTSEIVKNMFDLSFLRLLLVILTSTLTFLISTYFIAFTNKERLLVNALINKFISNYIHKNG